MRIIQTFVLNFGVVIAIFLVFALSFSLSTISAGFIASVLETLLFSALVLRIIEILTGSFSGMRGAAILTMEVTSIVLLSLSQVLEIISVGFRSFSLGFRIFANVSAGHVLSDIILVLRLPLNSVVTAFTQIIFSYFVLVYEILVATIQTGVFLSLFPAYAE